MNRKLRYLIALFAATALSLLGIAGCGGDGGQKATLTLDAGSGTVATQEYELEEGADLYEFLKDKTPTPEDGLTFAAWYWNGKPIEEGDTMSAGGGTVTAKYYAQYTLEVYLEEDGSFVKSEAESKTDRAIFGDPLTLTAPSVEHYAFESDREGTRLSSAALGKNEVFKAYYTIETYTVMYLPYAPAEAGLEGSIPSSAVRYGDSVTVADGKAYTVSPGYRFGGWATELGGAVEYRGGEVLTPSADVHLFGVWDVAYADRFGGADLLFFPQADEKEAVLVRAGQELTGTRDGENFSFEDAEGHEILKGRAAAGTFVYYRDAMKDVSYKHADAYTGAAHADGATLAFDGRGGAEFTDAAGAHTGSVTYDPATMSYTFTYTDGTARFSFMLTELTEGETSTPAFIFEGAEAGAYLGISLHYLGSTTEGIYGDLLVLDGYGHAYLFDGDDYLAAQTLTLYYVGTYVPDGDSGEVDFTLADSEGNITQMRAKLMTYGGRPVWFADLGYAGTYTDSDGAKLVLDRYGAVYGSAVYTKDGAETSGIFTLEPSPLGLAVRLIPQTGDAITFRIDTSTHTMERLGGGNYAEYLRYYGDTGEIDVNWPVLVAQNGSAKYYESKETVTEGTVSEVSGSQNRFLFTSSALKFEYELGEGYFEVAGRISYFHYFKMYPLAEQTGVRTLSGENGSGTIVLTDAGDAVYTGADGASHLGVCTILNGADFGLSYDIGEFMDISTGETRYFRFVKNDEQVYATFSVLGEETGLYLLYADGAVDEQVKLFLAANGEERKAFYREIAEDDAEQKAYGTYTIADGEGTLTYSQDGKDVTLQFLLDPADGTFAVHTDKWTGVKTFTNGQNSIALDGYYTAIYRGEGRELTAEYTFVSDTRIYLYGVTEEGIFEGYFDLDLGHGTYKACGYEVGRYYDDASDDLLDLDGYGKVTRYNITEHDGEGNLTKLEEGTYTVLDADEGILRITFEERSFAVKLYAVSDGEDLSHFYTVEDKAADTYRSAKWEFFTLDGFGNAYFTDAFGITYQGTYTKRSAHVYAFRSETYDGTAYIVIKEDKTCEVPTDGFVTDGKVLVKYLGGEKNVVIPDNITEIAALAFSERASGSRYDGAAIVTLDLKNVTSVGANAFNGCTELVSVTGNEVLTVAESAFYGCIELSAVTMQKLTTIGEFAFHLCESLEHIGFDKVTTVYSAAFSECHGLISAEFPAAVKFYEGVFYDCFLLETVTFGETLAQLGTPEEVVTGVFERSYVEEQAPLTLIFEGESVPVIGADLFAGVTYYTVKVPTMSVVKKFYADKSWAEYSLYIGIADTPRSFYCFNYGNVWALELDGTVKIIREGSVTAYGAYEIKEGQLLVYRNGLTEPVSLGDVDETAHTILVDVYGYGIDYKPGSWYYFYEVGNALELTVSYTDVDTTLTFTPVKGNFYTASTIFEVDAVFDENGAEKNVKVVLERNMYGSTTLYMVVDGKYRRSMSISYSSKEVSLGDPVFIPVVTTYTAEDTSYLALSQNDEAATQYTASFVIASIRDGDGTPLNASQVAVEADGKSFKVKDAIVFDGYSYVFTFTVETETGKFDYKVEAQRRTVVQNSSFRAVIYQNEDGEVANIAAYLMGNYDWEELDGKTEDYVYTPSQDGKVHEWVIYNYNYAGHYTLTLTGSGDALTGEISSGKVAKGYLNNTYAIVFYAGDDISMLYMRNTDGVYSKVDEQEISEKEGYLEVTHGGMTYYLTVNGESVEIVIADITYRSSEDSDFAGSLHIVTGPDGVISSATLTVGTETYTKFLTVEDDYLFFGTEKAYRAHITSGKCTIAEREIKTFTDETADAEIAVVVESDDVIGVISAKVGGTEYAAHIGENYTSWRDRTILVDAETPMCFVVNVGENTMQTVKLLVAETEDKTYRIYLAAAEEGDYKVVGLEFLYNGKYVWERIDYAAMTDGEYNCEIDVYADYYDEYSSYANLYFNITIDGDTCSATLYDISGY